MTSASAEWQKSKMKELKSTHQRCNKCNPCPLPRQSLEFSHLRPTEVHGTGRGRSKRIADIMKNPDAYVLSCHKRNFEIEKEQRSASKWESSVPAPLHKCSGRRDKKCRGTVFEMRGHYAHAHHGRCSLCHKFYTMKDLNELPLKMR